MSGKLRSLVCFVMLAGLALTGCSTPVEKPVEDGPWMSQLAPADSLGDIAHALPETTLAYLSLDLTRPKARAAYNSSIAKLFRDPEMTEFIDSGKGQVLMMAQGLLQKFKHERGFSLEDLTGLYRGRVNFAVIEVIPPMKGPPVVRIAVTIDGGEKVGDVKKAIDKLVALMKKHDPDMKVEATDAGAIVTSPDEPGFAYQIHKQSLVITVGPDEMNPFLAALKNGAAKPLSKSASYRSAKKTLGFDAAIAAAYVNTREISMMIMGILEPKQKALAKQLGLGDLTYAGYSVSAAHGAFQERLFLGSSAPNKGILGLLPSEPWKRKLLSYVPANAIYCSAGQFDAPKTYAAVSDLVTEIAPEKWMKAKMAIAMLEKELNLSLTQEILPLMSGEYAMFVAPRSGWKILPQVAMIVEVRDRKKAEKTIHQLAEYAIQQIKQHSTGGEARKHVMKMAMKTMTYGDHVIHYVGGSPVALAYTFDENRLIFTLLPQTLKEILDSQSDNTFVSITENDTFNEATARLPKGTLALEYIDSEAAIGLVYNLYLPLMQVANMVAENPFDMALLPPVDRFASRFEPYVEVYARHPDGLLVQVDGPVPGMGLYLGAMVPALVFTRWVQPHAIEARMEEAETQMEEAETQMEEAEARGKLMALLEQKLAERAELHAAPLKALPELMMLDQMIRQHHKKHGEYPPTGEKSLDAVRTEYLKARKEKGVSVELVDPWGNPYHYRVPSSDGKSDFDVWSSGPNGIDDAGEGDDIQAPKGMLREWPRLEEPIPDLPDDPRQKRSKSNG